MLQQAERWCRAWPGEVTAARDGQRQVETPGVGYGRFLRRAPNVFLPEGSSEEDLFTRAWHYLLCRRPNVGRGVLDLLTAKAGLPASQFHYAVNHPLSTERTQDYPDFLIHASPKPVLFEHKITADLGPEQMERYFSMAESMGAHLALVGARPIAVPADVLASPIYLRPLNGAQHLYWQDFAEWLAEPPFAGDDLVLDFREVMEHLGLQRSQWAGLGDPLTDAEASRRFRSILDDAAKKLAGEAKVVKLAPRNPGIQLRKPAPGVALVYLLFGARGLLLTGRVVRAQVFVESDNVLKWAGEDVPKVDQVMPGLVGVMFKGFGMAPWNRNLRCARYYETRFDTLLTSPMETVADDICRLVRGLLSDVRRDVLDENGRRRRAQTRATSAR